MSDQIDFQPGDLFSSFNVDYETDKSTDLRLCVACVTQTLYIFTPASGRYAGQSFVLSLELHTLDTLGDLIERVTG